MSAEQFQLIKKEYINAVTNQLEILKNVTIEDLDNIHTRTRLVDLRTKVVSASIQLTNFINSRQRVDNYINQVQSRLDKNHQRE